nr:ABC transporter ATP-binding protein [Phycisphaerales bacterium]
MIHLDAVIKSFGTLRAVDGLTLHVQPGQVLGLLGPNGAGKTTTISMATGLLAPDAGTIRISGHNPRDAHARAHIGVAPQSLALYDELSARENLSFFAAIFALHGRERTARVDEALALVGLADRQRDRVAHFSGGMKRRLNLAAAVLHHPKVVFMDEPTAGVDPHSRNAIFDIVRTLQAK